jgi:hypothetical protein
MKDLGLMIKQALKRQRRVSTRAITASRASTSRSMQARRLIELEKDDKSGGHRARGRGLSVHINDPCVRRSVRTRKNFRARCLITC